MIIKINVSTKRQVMNHAHSYKPSNACDLSHCISCWATAEWWKHLTFHFDACQTTDYCVLSNFNKSHFPVFLVVLVSYFQVLHFHQLKIGWLYFTLVVLIQKGRNQIVRNHPRKRYLFDLFLFTYFSLQSHCARSPHMTLTLYSLGVLRSLLFCYFMTYFRRLCFTTVAGVL